MAVMATAERARPLAPSQPADSFPSLLSSEPDAACRLLLQPIRAFKLQGMSVIGDFVVVPGVSVPREASFNADRWAVYRSGLNDVGAFLGNLLFRFGLGLTIAMWPGLCRGDRILATTRKPRLARRCASNPSFTGLHPSWAPFGSSHSFCAFASRTWPCRGGRKCRCQTAWPPMQRKRCNGCGGLAIVPDAHRANPFPNRCGHPQSTSFQCPWHRARGQSARQRAKFLRLARLNQTAPPASTANRSVKRHEVTFHLGPLLPCDGALVTNCYH